jgi:transcriptional regulator with XRE-family HTH domain
MDNVEGLAAEEEGWARMGRHLRELRLARGLFQVPLAELADVSEPTVRAIENHKPGKRHTPRTLAKISRALGQPEEYLNDYRLNPPAEEPGDKPKDIKTVPPPQPTPDLLAPRLDEIVVAALNEIVVPRLNSMEKEVRALADAILKTSGIVIDAMHPSDPE